MKPRERSVAHLWCDKRVPRLFRHHLDNKNYRKARDIYFALCEIDSDFVEERESKTKSIHNLTQTVATYTGMSINLVSEGLQALRKLELIDYGRKLNKKNQVIGSYLVLYEYIGESFYLEKLREMNFRFFQEKYISQEKINKMAELEKYNESGKPSYIEA